MLDAMTGEQRERWAPDTRGLRRRPRLQRRRERRAPGARDSRGARRAATRSRRSSSTTAAPMARPRPCVERAAAGHAGDAAAAPRAALRAERRRGDRRARRARRLDRDARRRRAERSGRHSKAASTRCANSPSPTLQARDGQSHDAPRHLAAARVVAHRERRARPAAQGRHAGHRLRHQGVRPRRVHATCRASITCTASCRRCSSARATRWSRCPVNHRERTRGTSKYGLHNRLWVGIVDLFGMMWLIRRASPRVPVPPRNTRCTDGAAAPTLLDRLLRPGADDASGRAASICAGSSGSRCLLIGAGLGLRDPWPADEPRFALVARDMLAHRRLAGPARRRRPLRATSRRSFSG